MFSRQVNLVLGGLLLLAVVGLGLRYAYVSWRAESLETKNDVLTSDATADKTYVREYKTVIAEQEKTNAEVDRVLEEHRDWSEQPLPDDVADILRDPAESAP